MCFPDWYGLRSLTGTSTSSINGGANLPASALTKPAAGWQAAIHPEDLPGLLERWRSILASGEPGEMEVRLRRFDGEYRRFLFRARPLPTHPDRS